MFRRRIGHTISFSYIEALNQPIFNVRQPSISPRCLETELEEKRSKTSPLCQEIVQEKIFEFLTSEMREDFQLI